jgi:hypothetical protein
MSAPIARSNRRARSGPRLVNLVRDGQVTPGSARRRRPAGAGGHSPAEPVLTGIVLPTCGRARPDSLGGRYRVTRPWHSRTASSCGATACPPLRCTVGRDMNEQDDKLGLHEELQEADLIPDGFPEQDPKVENGRRPRRTRWAVNPPPVRPKSGEPTAQAKAERTGDDPPCPGTRHVPGTQTVCAPARSRSITAPTTSRGKSDAAVRPSSSSSGARAGPHALHSRAGQQVPEQKMSGEPVHRCRESTPASLPTDANRSIGNRVAIACQH